MPIHEFRNLFPSLGSGIAYLDSAAKTLTPACVLEAAARYYRECDANVERGLHRAAQDAACRLAEAREQVASLVHGDAGEIVFVRNTTEAIGLVAAGLDWQRGDRIVTTLAEHHSNYLPWLRLAAEEGIALTAVRPATDGRVDPDDVRAALAGGRTRLVAFSHVSNALGTIQPAAEIVRIAREAGALTLIDGAQSVPHLPVDVHALGCDFLAWSGHKMFGPTGTGALWGRAELLRELRPLHVGGGVARDVDADAYSIYREPPHRALEAGTPDVAGLIGFGEAARFLAAAFHSGVLASNCHALAVRTAAELRKIPGVTVAGPADGAPRAGVVSFWIDGISPHAAAAVLDEQYAVLLRSGHHCTLPLMKEVLGHPEGTVRASFSFYSSEEEAAQLIEGVRCLAAELRGRP